MTAAQELHQKRRGTVAHPDFRAELHRQADHLMLW